MYIYYITEISLNKNLFNDIPVREMKKVKIKSIIALTFSLSLCVSFIIRSADVYSKRKNVFKSKNRNRINIRKIDYK